MADADGTPPVADGDDFGAAVGRALRELGGDRDEASMMLGIQVVRAGNAFAQASERRVHRPRSLRWTGFTMMFLLMVYRKLEARTLARLTGITRQAASIVIATLERDGFVRRAEPAAEDRRLVPLSLSAEGDRVVREALAEQLTLSEQWFAVLEPAERAELNRLLGKLLAPANPPRGAA